jgi:transposase
MNNNLLFEAALSINKPWYIDRVEFDASIKRIDIFIDFQRGAKFSSEEEGYDDHYGVYDPEQKAWRHLIFFEHECYHNCRTPQHM